MNLRADMNYPLPVTLTIDILKNQQSLPWLVSYTYVEFEKN